MPRANDTYAWIENAPEDLFAQGSRIRRIKTAGPQSFVVVIPRYQEFTTVVSQLATRNVRFVEIAGNDEVLLTALVSRDWTYDLSPGEFVFSTGILTQPDVKRIAVRSSVGSLHIVLNDLAARGIRVEHVYDF